MGVKVLDIIGVVVLVFVVLAGAFMLIVILAAARLNRRSK